MAIYVDEFVFFCHRGRSRRVLLRGLLRVDYSMPTMEEPPFFVVLSLFPRFGKVTFCWALSWLAPGVKRRAFAGG